MKKRKQHSRANKIKVGVPAPFMQPQSVSNMAAREVERMLQNHMEKLGEFMQSLGVTEENIKEFHVETRAEEIGGPIGYTVYKASDKSTPLGSKII